MKCWYINACDINSTVVVVRQWVYTGENRQVFSTMNTCTDTNWMLQRLEKNEWLDREGSMDTKAQILERKAEGRTWLQIPGEANLQAVYDAAACPPLLKRSFEIWMDWQRRSASGVQQALRAARLAPEFVAALYALDARIVSGNLDGPVSLAEAMERKAEVLTGDWMVEVPVCPANQETAFEAVKRTPADDPITAAACAVEFDGTNATRLGLAVTGVQRGGAVPVDTGSLAGAELTEQRIQDFVNNVEFEGKLLDDFQGSKEYRAAMVKVVMRRALTACAQGKDRQ